METIYKQPPLPTTKQSTVQIR